MFFNAILAALFLFDNQKSTAVYFGPDNRTSLAFLTTRDLLNDFSSLTTLLTRPQKQHENSRFYENSVPKQKYCARSDSENQSPLHFLNKGTA
jgi:hypothetical protein